MSDELNLPILPEGYRWNVSEDSTLHPSCIYYTVSLEKKSLVLGFLPVWRAVESDRGNLYKNVVHRKMYSPYQTAAELVDVLAQEVYDTFSKKQSVADEDSVIGVYYTHTQDSTKED